jgi:hypothetical protein
MGVRSVRGVRNRSVSRALASRDRSVSLALPARDRS